jgi:hypothetical protein
MQDNKIEKVMLSKNNLWSTHIFLVCVVCGVRIIFLENLYFKPYNFENVIN